MEKDIVCLGLRRKRSGVSSKLKSFELVGILLNSDNDSTFCNFKWVRPTEKRIDGGLSQNTLIMDNGEFPRTLDIISVPLQENCPKLFQTENWTIDTNSKILHKGTFSFDKLDNLLDTPPTLWTNHKCYEGVAYRIDSSYKSIPVDNERVATGRSLLVTDRSVYFIKVTRSTICVEPHKNNKIVKIIFDYNDLTYGLVVRDIEFEKLYLQKNIGRYSVTTPHYLCVTLGLPNGNYPPYMFVAGVIIPNATQNTINDIDTVTPVEITEKKITDNKADLTNGTQNNNFSSDFNHTDATTKNIDTNTLSNNVNAPLIDQNNKISLAINAVTKGIRHQLNKIERFDNTQRQLKESTTTNGTQKEVTIICLSNSLKNGAHNIAGILNDTGGWVHLIGCADGGLLLDSEIAYEGGASPKIFDIIKLTICEQKSQLDNCVNYKNVSSIKWEKIGTFDKKDIEKLTDHPNTLWDAKLSSRYGLYDKIDIEQANNSSCAYLINVEKSVVSVITDENSMNEVYIRFSYNNHFYKIPLDDDEFKKDYLLKPNGNYPVENPHYICVVKSPFINCQKDYSYISAASIIL